MPSIVLPSESTPVVLVASAASAQRSVGGRPSVDRELQRPGDGDPRVALDQVVGLEPLHPAPDGVGASTRPSRGCRSAPRGAPPCRRRRRPGRGRWLLSGNPFASHHAAARRWSSGIDLGLTSPQLRHAAARGTVGGSGTTHGDGSSGTTSRLLRSNRSRMRADPVTPTTASQSGPHMRSRIDVSDEERQPRPGETRSRISERR